MQDKAGFIRFSDRIEARWESNIKQFISSHKYPEIGNISIAPDVNCVFFLSHKFNTMLTSSTESGNIHGNSSVFMRNKELNKIVYSSITFLVECFQAVKISMYVRDFLKI